MASEELRLMDGVGQAKDRDGSPFTGAMLVCVEVLRAVYLVSRGTDVLAHACD